MGTSIWTLHTSIACIGAMLTVAPGWVPAAEEPPSTGRDVLFSELSLAATPGSQGSWIELYNRATQQADVSGVTIIHNGTVILALPAAFAIPGRSLLLLRFTDPGEAVGGATRSRCNTTVLTVKPVPSAQPHKPGRTAGYCALVRPVAGQQGQLLDYVRWGRAPLPDDADYTRRAARIGAWHERRSGPVYVGEDPGPGDPLVPAGSVALSRFSFDARLDPGYAWCVVSLREASPGEGNVELAAPVIVDPLDGVQRYREDGLGVAYMLPGAPDMQYMTQGPAGETGYRLEMAVDPHFGEIVAAAVTGTQTSHRFAPEQLPKGPCFLRVRWQSGQLTTRWSQTVCVLVK